MKPYHIAQSVSCQAADRVVLPVLTLHNTDSFRFGCVRSCDTCWRPGRARQKPEPEQVTLHKDGTVPGLNIVKYKKQNKFSNISRIWKTCNTIKGIAAEDLSSEQNFCDKHKSWNLNVNDFRPFIDKTEFEEWKGESAGKTWSKGSGQNQTCGRCTGLKPLYLGCPLSHADELP